MNDNKAPRRKKHRNSKLGCATCKRRRVKCPEDLPECSNCAKHNSRCDYLDYTEKQLEALRRSKEERQKAQDASKSLDASTSLESLSLSKKPWKKAPKPRVGDESSSDLSKAASRPPSLRSLAGGSGSSISDASLKEHMSGVPVEEPLEAHLPQGHGHYFKDELASLPPDDLVPLMVHPFDQALSPEKFTSGLTQDFDNLLTTQDQEIIYPVYLGAGASHGFEAAEVEYPVAFSLGLPNAVPSRKRFPVMKNAESVKINYKARLIEALIELGPSIASGSASLSEIRKLYHLWLTFFVYTAFRSRIMFPCLVNLTTNYLISNVFSGVDQRRLNEHFQVPNFRNTLVTHSIQHYAVAIRELRSVLNYDVPVTAASVSYILSLMSIYDPDATINSAVCFRDGMFSVLGYMHHVAKKNNALPSPLMPIHLHLVGNISRTIFFPAYDPAFLDEYEIMLHRTGRLFAQMRSSVSNPETYDFILRTYNELCHICRDSRTMYIPQANSNLRDLRRQTEIIFTLFLRWARFNPSRLLVSRPSTDPLENLLNIYVILFRKAIYAVLPQGKFIFLRDLNSPLMLDVYKNFNELEFYDSLDTPSQVCIDANVYRQLLPEIKTLAAYAIRVYHFIGARTQFLYKSLVFNEKVRRFYPIKNIVEWRLSVTDIHATRKEFQDCIGLVETMIKSFNSTYICTHHYPRIVPSDELANMPEPPVSESMPSQPWVDLLSLDHRGLLQKDMSPPFPIEL